ncbi:hypothetical protein NBE98_05035 [Clostridium swellfunianum]|uniref:hypothetical protein n=1 Tax=Clostridium swellfunianum TaxID=1367462 RepID=UPI00203022D2|nr:hypothetical protein [Clostridium swellfunianum]MCM0647741.1 hypothetical protein [Clostridium swellfunianum]
MGGFFNSSLGIAALVVIVLVIIYFVSPKPKRNENEEDNHEKQIAVSSIPTAKEETAAKQKELELVAAIMGALSAYLEVPASSLIIRSIKRVDGNNSVWREHGLE